jgi:hypothetical protein
MVKELRTNAILLTRHPGIYRLESIISFLTFLKTIISVITNILKTFIVLHNIQILGIEFIS